MHHKTKQQYKFKCNYINYITYNVDIYIYFFFFLIIPDFPLGLLLSCHFLLAS